MSAARFFCWFFFSRESAANCGRRRIRITSHLSPIFQGDALKYQTNRYDNGPVSKAAVQSQSAAPINALAPMIRVADVECSAKFYELLGFQIGNYVPREAPPMHWAWLYQPGGPNWKTGANLMVARSKEQSGGEPHCGFVPVCCGASCIAAAAHRYRDKRQCDHVSGVFAKRGI